MRTRLGAVTTLLLSAVFVLPSAAFAVDTVTVATVQDTYTLPTNEAPASLKRWVAEREVQAPKKQRIAIALILIMTVAGAASSYLMTMRRADADRMTGDAHNRWMRDRDVGKWNQWGR
jgi:heme/copper-type cytochrome/quinol oxidase subunit 3